MSKVVSLRLKDDQVQRLERVARRLRRAPSQAAALLLEEALRMEEFPFVEFRDTILGREAFVKGTRLKLWQLEWLARTYEHDVARLVEHLDEPAHKIEAALSYARAYPEEMETAIGENRRSYEELKQILPNLEIFRVDATAP